VNDKTEEAVEVTLVEPVWRDVELEPEQRTTRGSLAADPQAPEHLKGWLKLGIPIVTQLGGPPGQAGFRFDHVLLAVSMRPSEGELFTQVWLKVVLESSANQQQAAIAWSLSPRVAFNAIEVTNKIKLDSSLKFGVGEVGAGGEREEKLTERDVFLQAFNELRFDPVWEFNALKTQPLVGSHRLHLIVRRALGVACRGTVALSATVSRKRFGLIPYRAASASMDGAGFEFANEGIVEPSASRHG
jgi:hypothetical protein